MTITKEAVAKQVGEIPELLDGALKGLPVGEQVRFLVKKGYYTSAICKVMRLSGRHIAEMLRGSPAPAPSVTLPIRAPVASTALSQDMKDAATIRGLKLPEARPIIEREIEDAAWFHNVIQGIGKYVTFDLATCVPLDEADQQDAGKVLGKFIAYYRTLQGLKADASHVVDVEADNAELEYALKLEQKYRAKLQRFIDVVTTSICRECRIKALTSFVLSPEVIGKEIMQ